MSNTTEYGPLIMRLALGTVMITHSIYLKLIVFTLPGTATFFGSLGLPEFMAYVVFVLEAVGGVALILGFYSRYAAAILIPVLLGATWAHWPAGWLFSNTNGGWEYPLFLALAAISQVFLGDGAYAVKDVLAARQAKPATT